MHIRRLFKPWRAWPLATQILVGVLGILVLTVMLGGYLYSRISSQTLEHQYQLRALGVATTVAAMPEIVNNLAAGDPNHRIRVIAAKIRTTAQVAYVVVADRDGVRFSHPNPKLIGKKLEEGVAVLDGESHLGIDPGSLGRSANAKAPIFNANGLVIGEVSVGILETREQDQLSQDVELIVMYSILALLLSAAVSLFLSRGIKRATFGLEPSAIGTLLQEREALLHSIREGMIGFDSDGRITVVNEEAKRLLGLDGLAIGKRLDAILKPGRLLDLLTGKVGGIDQITLTDNSLLAVNRMEVSLSGRDVGSVVTVRDRTEVESLIREVRTSTGLSEALRAQEHEYANRLHVVAGLIELGEYDQAAVYLAQISNTPSFLGEGLTSRIEPPELAALLLAKITIAAERGVTLTIPEDAHADRQPNIDPQMLLTIIGNLIDNAIEALSEQSGPRQITVDLSDAHGLKITVTDNGPGVPADQIDDVLVDGFSTKQAGAHARRGLGLALVSRIVRRSGGTITVKPGPGGHFEVFLPAPDVDAI